MRIRFRARGATSVAPMQHRWMVSYLDVLTILLILFVAVAAHAVQPAVHGVDARPALAAEPPPAAPPPRPDSPGPDALLNSLAARGLLTRGWEAHREPWGLVIGLPRAVFFPPGDERIPDSALPVVEELAAILRTFPNNVNLAGNADSVPIHNRRFRNNWELSAARGMALLDLLATKYGVEESRMSVTSFGSFRPREPNDSPESRAENRRVEVTILDVAKP